MPILTLPCNFVEVAVVVNVGDLAVLEGFFVSVVLPAGVSALVVLKSPDRLYRYTKGIN